MSDVYAKICTCYCPPQACPLASSSSSSNSSVSFLLLNNAIPYLGIKKTALFGKAILFKVAALCVIIFKLCGLYFIKVLLYGLYFFAFHESIHLVFESLVEEVSEIVTSIRLSGFESEPIFN